MQKIFNIFVFLLALGLITVAKGFCAVGMFGFLSEGGLHYIKIFAIGCGLFSLGVGCFLVKLFLGPGISGFFL